MGEHVVVLTAAASREEANRIANALVERRLVACASVISGMTSVYWWQGEVTQSEEALVVMKSRRSRADDVIAQVEALHSYEVPEVLVLGVEQGSERYLAWIDQVCSV